MAFTSDRFDGTVPRKHADAAAIGLMQTAARRLVLLVHNGDNSLFLVLTGVGKPSAFRSPRGHVLPGVDTRAGFRSPVR